MKKFIRNSIFISLFFGSMAVMAIALGVNFLLSKPTYSTTATGHTLPLMGNACHGLDGSTYRDLLVDSSGRLIVATTSGASAHVTILRDAAALTVNAGNNGITADTTLNSATTNLRLMGISIRESAATAAVATVVLRHGVVSGTCTGNEIGYIELNANESLQLQYQPRGLVAASGVCADVIAGTVDVATHTIVEAAP